MYAIRSYYEEKIPEIIFIGVGYPDKYNADLVRLRDFNSFEGILNFNYFLKKELLPYCDKVFNADENNRSLIGFSLGGLFGVFPLFNTEEIADRTFKNFSLSDPTLFVADTINGVPRTVFTFEQAYFNKSKELPVKLFMGTGNDIYKTNLYYCNKFDSVMNCRNYKGLDYVYHISDIVITSYSIHYTKLYDEYGMLSEEKFYDRGKKFTLLKNVDGKYFTLDEYKDIITTNQTDKDDQLVYLYTTDVQGQHSFIEAAKNKGYDVLVMDGQLDSHFINSLESKFEKSRFVRVDGDVVDKLIPKAEEMKMNLTDVQKQDLTSVFSSQVPKGDKTNFIVTFEAMGENDTPVMITQQEFMRRMKEMSQLGGGGMNFYGELPDSYNLVVNGNHPLVTRILEDEEAAVGEKVSSLRSKIESLDKKKTELQKAKEGKKDEEIPQADKDELVDIEKKISDLRAKKEEELKGFADGNKMVSQLIDLALLSNNMLKGA